MKTLRRACMCTGLILLMSVFLAACGQGGTPTASNNNTMMNDPTATPTMGYQMTTPTTQATMGAQATPTVGGMTGDNGNVNAFVHTAFVMLNGKKVHVLTTNKGFALYYYLKDTMNTSKCTGGCAQNWPPLLQPQGMMTISSSVMLPHKLTVHMTANGKQVFYDGHALYSYAGDMQAGQISGRGMDNTWYLVGINL